MKPRLCAELAESAGFAGTNLNINSRVKKDNCSASNAAALLAHNVTTMYVLRIHHRLFRDGMNGKSPSSECRAARARSSSIEGWRFPLLTCPCTTSFPLTSFGLAVRFSRSCRGSTHVSGL